MDYGGKVVLIGQNVSFWLLREKTTIVNSSPFVVTIANLLILVATLVANTWAIHIIHNKETSRINRSAVWQCQILNCVTRAPLLYFIRS